MYKKIFFGIVLSSILSTNAYAKDKPAITFKVPLKLTNIKALNSIDNQTLYCLTSEKKIKNFVDSSGSIIYKIYSNLKLTGTGSVRFGSTGGLGVSDNGKINKTIEVPITEEKKSNIYNSNYYTCFVGESRHSSGYVTNLILTNNNSIGKYKVITSGKIDWYSTAQPK